MMAYKKCRCQEALNLMQHSLKEVTFWAQCGGHWESVFRCLDPCNNITRTVVKSKLHHHQVIINVYCQ
jgi:hypothetical protein